jgi:hypothetical protein
VRKEEAGREGEMAKRVPGSWPAWTPHLWSFCRPRGTVSRSLLGAGRRGGETGGGGRRSGWRCGRARGSSGGWLASGGGEGVMVVVVVLVELCRCGAGEATH